MLQLPAASIAFRSLNFSSLTCRSMSGAVGWEHR